VVAYLDEKGHSQVVRNSEGDILTPSVVQFEDQEVIVGKEAKKAAAVRADAVADFVKRDMGKKHYSRLIRGEKLHPEVIQACILKKLKDDAITALGSDLHVVITVPAYFDEPRRKATADAGEMAGLAVLDIVNEPTAAALSFGESLGYLTAEGEPREPMKVLVYDLGGGTFDVTVLDLRPGDLRTLATDGDVQLGGYDWDMRLVNYAAEEFQKRHRLDPRQSPASLAALQAAAEEAKQSLTARPKTLMAVRHGGHSLELPITREQFEELSEDLLERTAYTSRQVLAASGLSWKQINRVLLVGGSTRMPMVSRMIEKLTGLTPDHTVHPDEAVARGAAVFAGYLIRSQDPKAKRSFNVIDVNSHSLGIEGIDQRTLRKENVIIIPRNSPLPAKVTEKFVTKSEDQISIVVQVLEGESKTPGQCSPIGRAVIRNLPEHLPKGWPVEVTYEYLTNGRLDVKAKIPGTSRQVELELQREQSLTSERIGRWKSVVAEAKGFDAFEGMLDDVLQAHRKDRRIAAREAKREPIADEDDDDAPKRDLSAASRAFAEIADDPSGRRGGSAGGAAQGSKAGKSSAGSATATPKAATPAEPRQSREDTTGGKSTVVATGAMARPAGPKPKPVSAVAPGASATKGRSAPRIRVSGPVVNAVALLVVSAVTLLGCYYVLCWATHSGNFLKLPLPFLPPAKETKTTEQMAPHGQGIRHLAELSSAYHPDSHPHSIAPSRT
jgi:molecular chaperone DnaK